MGRLQVADAGVTGLYLLLEPWLADISGLSPRVDAVLSQTLIEYPASTTLADLLTPLLLQIHFRQCGQQAKPALSFPFVPVRQLIVCHNLLTEAVMQGAICQGALCPAPRGRGA